MIELPHSPVLASLDSDLRATILRRGERRALEPGEPLWEHGSDVERSWIVLSGLLCMARQTALGLLHISDLGPGEVAGEEAPLDLRAAFADVLTVEPATVLAFPPDLFDGGGGPQEARLLWVLARGLAGKQRSVDQRIHGFFSAEQGEPMVGMVGHDDLMPVARSMEVRRQVLHPLGLSSMELNYLASLAEAFEVTPGGVVMRRGENDRDLFVVLSGRMMVSTMVPGAGLEALSFLGPGQIFGELALLDGQARSADVSATEEGAVVLRLREEFLKKMLQPNLASSPRLLRALCQLLALRVRDTVEKLTGWYLLSGGQAPA